jgi:hypothetical protein
MQVEAAIVRLEAARTKVGLSELALNHHAAMSRLWRTKIPENHRTPAGLIESRIEEEKRDRNLGEAEAHALKMKERMLQAILNIVLARKG